MRAYNYYLHTQRLALGLSLRKMGKALHVGSFRYRLIENGYLKPKKKEIERFSAFFGEDFTPYVEGPESNPADLPREKERKIVKWAWELLGKAWLRITLGVVTLLLLGVFISGAIVSEYVGNHSLEFYSETYQTLVHDIQKSPEKRFSLVGEFMTPQITHKYEDENGYPVMTYIYARNENYPYINYCAIHRGAGWRAEFVVSSIDTDANGEDRIVFMASVTALQEMTRFSIIYEYYGEDNWRVGMTSRLPKMESNPEIIDQIEKEVTPLGIVFIHDVNDLLTDKTYTSNELSLKEVLLLYRDGENLTLGYTAYGFFAFIAGMILMALALFGFLFAMFYGRKKDAPAPFTRSFVMVLNPPPKGKKPLKKDIRFTPFIPELFLELVGIALVFYGSLRAAGYAASFFGISSLSLGDFMNGGAATQYLGVFMIGMFLLYILDFDAYMEDKRVVRCIFQYAIIFFVLYELEVLLMDSLEASSVLGSFVNRIPIPNMFGSIACYFIITYCLFFTPKWAKKKKGLLVLHRLCAIIPIAYILTAWILYRGNGIWFKLDWPRQFLFLFNGEKLPFSILAITYLVGYYFIRLFFEKKYGEENANIYFNSNRFIWIKNIYLSLIIAGVGIAEFVLRKNVIANKLDFGFYWQIIFLIPFILFYHPHKGERKMGVDIATTALYMLALIFCYTLCAVAIILGFVLNAVY